MGANLIMQSGTIISKSTFHKIGEKYIQLSNPDGTWNSDEAPENKFGGLWSIAFPNEGIVFQTEGYDGEGRTNGLMENQLQGFRLNIPIGGYDTSGGQYGSNISGNPVWYAYDAVQPISATPLSGHQYITDGLHGVIKVGTRVAHENRLMRIWKKVG